MPDSDKKADENAKVAKEVASGGERKAGQPRAADYKSGDFTNEPDPRSPEQQQEDIRLHGERSTALSDKALDDKLSEYDPADLGLCLYGGMNLTDTRKSSSRFAPGPSVDNTNLAARRRVAENNKGVDQAIEREEAGQRNLGRDATARAEVIARH